MNDKPLDIALGGFARYLAENNILNEQTASDAFQQAVTNQTSYIDFLIKNRLMNDTQAAVAVSDYFGLPYFDIRAMDREQVPVGFLNIELVRRRQAFPLLIRHGLLYLAVTDPISENLYESRFLTGYDIRLVIVERNRLNEIIDEHLNSLLLSEIIGTNAERAGDAATVSAHDESAEIRAYDVDSAPVVNYVNKVILDAIDKGVSDIHFEQYENTLRIRYRIHGRLYPIPESPGKMGKFILARIKIMSSLDITEHRVPQDGRFKLNLPQKKTVDFRVSICPMLFGEKIVLRILDMANTVLDLSRLGMESNDEVKLRDALSHTQGVILVTGPTGSGKTITLYSSLHHLNSGDVNISAVEDPVEITLFGINQVHVNPKIGLTFAAALRSFLRQDPDIIMVGEIRDLETAEIAVKAAQTGHLVLSTLHTNSSAETIIRLMNIGIESYNLASSLVAIVAQRLLRVLCNACKQRETISEDVLVKEGFTPDEASKLQLYKAGSCDRCVHGYTGRTGIFEVMTVSEEISKLIMQGDSGANIALQAEKEGMVSLREAGLRKVREGVTSLAELNSVFK